MFPIGPYGRDEDKVNEALSIPMQIARIDRRLAVYSSAYHSWVRGDTDTIKLEGPNDGLATPFSCLQIIDDLLDSRIELNNPKEEGPCDTSA